MTLKGEDNIQHNMLDFEQQLQSAQNHLVKLEQSSSDSPSSLKDLQTDSIYELSVALEELHVSHEEIRVQNEELLVTHQSLELEQQRYQELFEFAPDGYLVTNPQGVIQKANYASEILLNLNRDTMVGKPFIVFVAETDRTRVRTQLNQLANSQPPKDFEISLKPRNRSAFQASIAISLVHDLQGKWVGLRWLVRDISDREQAQQFYYDAFHDSLTGLANRALLLDRLGHLLDRCQRHTDQRFALLFLDLDRFKSINDSLGHLVGDQLLVEMAYRLNTCIRKEDTLARLGGDEFVILLEEIRDFSEADHCAVRIQDALRVPHNLNNHEVVVQCSIGIALSSPHYRQSTEMLRDADLAMYHAKQNGGACHQIFTLQMHTNTLGAFRLEEELNQAIQRQEFRIHYQPIISLATQELKGFEALVRWQHPERGLLLPGEFLLVAEATGLIVSIDRWVMRTACQQMKNWQAEFECGLTLSMSTNISSRLFSQPTLAAEVQSILKDVGLAPQCLKLEITEGVIMKDCDLAIETLTQLQALHVQLLIDDFGTGYSSFSRLQNLPFDGLKIDRSFLRDSKSIEIAGIILSLAHTLGMYSSPKSVVKYLESIIALESVDTYGRHI